MRKHEVIAIAAYALAACGGNEDPACNAGSGVCVYSAAPTEPSDLPGGRAAHLFVAAPDGAGDACSEAAPCTLEAAKQRVAGLNEARADGVVVELRDGVYRLAAPLRFSAADSGSAQRPAIWRASPGARPVLSGARRVTGWTKQGDVWSASVPKGTATRQLYVDGVRAPIAQGVPPVEMTGSAAGYEAADETYAAWRNPSDIELVFTGGNGAWTEPRCRVSTIEGTRITLQQPCWNNVTNRPKLARPAYELPSMDPRTTPTRIENAYELMQPGQWYLDTRAATLFYHAPTGLDVEQADVELPVLEQLIVGEGTLEEPVHDIAFTGIELAYATWNDPSGPAGFAEIQANIRITGELDAPPQGTCSFSEPKGTCPYGAYTREPGNVSWRAAERIAFVRNRFTHLGAAGLVFELGSRDNRIEGNVFEDISGIAIQLGDTDDPNGERAIVRGNLIANNLIHDIGAEYAGAVGILLFFTQHSVVRNNQIFDVPYTGISSGAVAGHANIPSSPDTTTSINADNEISHNLIFRYLTKLNDGGAIYLEGHQNQTVYDGAVIDSAASYADGLRATGNVVFHQGGEGNALYNDIGSQWIVWRDNVQWQAPAAHGGCLPVGHISFVSNYHSDHLEEYGCGKPIDVTYADNMRIARRPSPEHLPEHVIRGAGLEPAFHALSADAAPRIEYVQPSSGRADAGTLVLIAGSGFQRGVEVSWNDRPASSVRLLSSNFIYAIAPVDADLSALRLDTTRMRINDTDPAIEYLGAWEARKQLGSYDDDTEHRTEKADAAVRYSFEGTGIDLICSKDSDRGDIDIFIDDDLRQTASCYSRTFRSQQVCARIERLTPGRHTLRITKRTGRYLALDALQVR